MNRSLKEYVEDCMVAGAPKTYMDSYVYHYVCAGGCGRNRAVSQLDVYWTFMGSRAMCSECWKVHGQDWVANEQVQDQ
jgi:hypothetical protein